MLQLPLGLIHKENASFPSVTFLLVRPCNEDMILCLHFSLLSRVCALGNQAKVGKGENILDLDVYDSPLKLFASYSLDANGSLRTHEKKKGFLFHLLLHEHLENSA